MFWQVSGNAQLQISDVTVVKMAKKFIEIYNQSKKYGTIFLTINPLNNRYFSQP